MSYTEQTGLPLFDCAAVTANGNWYFGLALESMGAKPCYRCRSVKIGPSYTQYVHVLYGPQDVTIDSHFLLRISKNKGGPRNPAAHIGINTFGTTNFWY